MGDRTWGRFYCLLVDAEYFENHLAMGPEFETDACASMHIMLFLGEHTPIDPGLLDEAERLDKPFIYIHGEGIEYGAHERVCDGFQVSEYEMGHQAVGYVIHPLTQERDLEMLEHHLILRKRTLEKFGLKELPCT